MGGVLWKGGGGDLHAHMWIFSHQQTASVACCQRVTESAYAAHVALLFSEKLRNDSSRGIASNFARSLVIAKWKPFRRISGFSATMRWISHKLRSGTTDSKMAAHRWRAMLVPVGPQQAEMTSSLTKCGLWSCRTVVSPSENLRRKWG